MNKKLGGVLWEYGCNMRKLVEPMPEGDAIRHQFEVPRTITAVLVVPSFAAPQHPIGEFRRPTLHL